MKKLFFLFTTYMFGFMMMITGIMNANALTGEEQGQEFANNSIKANGNLTNSTNGNNVVPGYTTNAPEENYYKGGMGNINQAGNTKVEDCANQQSGGSTNSNLQCEAINMVNKNYDSRPLYSIDPKQDEIIVNSEKIKKDSAKTVQNDQTCFLSDVKKNAVYEEQACVEGKPYFTKTCSIVINKVCTAQQRGSICNAKTGIDAAALSATGGNNDYIKYLNNKLYFGLGSTSDFGVGSWTSKYSLFIKNRDSLTNIKLENSIYDDAYQLKINGVIALSVNMGGESNNQQHSSNVELGQYFKEGENTLELTVYNNVPHSPFRADLVIDIPLYCPCSLVETNSCTVGGVDKNEQCYKQKSECIFKDNAGDCVARREEMLCIDTHVSGSTSFVGDCQQYKTPKCTQIGSHCSAKDANGSCYTFSQTYRCEKTPATSVKETICVEAKCIDGKCYSKTENKNKTFGEAVAMMEVAREATVYAKEDPKTREIKVFRGDESKCTVKLLGGHNIMSCCKEVQVDVSRSTNNQTNVKETQAHGNDPNTPAQQTEGSTYQYDDLYNEDSKTLSQIQSTLTGGWLQCSKEERELGIKRGGSLCSLASTWCSEKKPLIGCIEESRAFCCFKSILAKIINREGRKQLQLSTETCDGLTIEQLKKIDFSKIDMTEFIESIVPKNTTSRDKEERIKNQVNKQISEGYYEKK